MPVNEATITLWRPVGPKELELIEQAGMRAFPPRLPEQPIFYPVLSEEYAVKIARDSNVPASGSGFVTRFQVKRTLIDRYEVKEAGGRSHSEYWIPAEDLNALQCRDRWPDRGRPQLSLRSCGIKVCECAVCVRRQIDRSESCLSRAGRRLPRVSQPPDPVSDQVDAEEESEDPQPRHRESRQNHETGQDAKQS